MKKKIISIFLSFGLISISSVSFTAFCMETNSVQEKNIKSEETKEDRMIGMLQCYLRFDGFKKAGKKLNEYIKKNKIVSHADVLNNFREILPIIKSIIEEEIVNENKKLSLCNDESFMKKKWEGHNVSHARSWSIVGKEHTGIDMLYERIKKEIENSKEINNKESVLEEIKNFKGTVDEKDKNGKVIRIRSKKIEEVRDEAHKIVSKLKLKNDEQNFKNKLMKIAKEFPSENELMDELKKEVANIYYTSKDLKKFKEYVENEKKIKSSEIKYLQDELKFLEEFNNTVTDKQFREYANKIYKEYKEAEKKASSEEKKEEARVNNKGWSLEFLNIILQGYFDGKTEEAAIKKQKREEDFFYDEDKLKKEKEEIENFIGKKI